MDNERSSAKKFSLNIEGRLFGFGTSPEVDWKIIFMSAVVLGVLLIALSAYIFIKIDKAELFAIEQSADQSEKTLDTKALKEVVSYYQNKAIEFEKIKNSVTASTDPSL
jgi:hypothetical protein